MKIMLTGDLHLGRSYQREEPEIATKYQEAQLESLANVTSTANREQCGVIIIAGDLFDRTSGIPVGLMKDVCKTLAAFDGEQILILPGNHDYYNPDTDSLWGKFEALAPANIKILKKQERTITGNVAFYPCPCTDKHSLTNGLGWIKNFPEREKDMVHIGIVHGAIEGMSYDPSQRYYYMPLDELTACNMDLWLAGHSHVCTIGSGRGAVYNAGSPQQLDMAESTEGKAIVIDVGLDKAEAHAVQTGVLMFAKMTANISINDHLDDILNKIDLPEETSLKLTVTGTLSEEEYGRRQEAYESLRRQCIKLEIDDSGLRKEITAKMIDDETPEGSVLNALLKSYQGQPELLNLAYDTMCGCRQ